jgi:hypothetical protein
MLLVHREQFKGVNQMTTTTKAEFRTPAQVLATGIHPAAVSPTTLVGTWTNVDHATRDIVKIVISHSGSALKVEVYGACTPTPCDWGSVSAIAYAANVSSSPAVAFSANYSFSFSKVVVTGHLSGKHLILETFTEFTDGSGRSNYYASDTMAK